MSCKDSQLVDKALRDVDRILNDPDIQQWIRRLEAEQEEDIGNLCRIIYEGLEEGIPAWSLFCVGLPAAYNAGVRRGSVA